MSPDYHQNANSSNDSGLTDNDKTWHWTKAEVSDLFWIVTLIFVAFAMFCYLVLQVIQ